MANPGSKSELFPTIGQVADQTDQQQENENTQGNDQAVTSLTQDNEDRPVTVIESLCMNCEEQVRCVLFRKPKTLVLTYISRNQIWKGTTRLLLTSIPFFREVVVMSFHCPHCGFSNNEIQSAGTIRREFTFVPCIYAFYILTNPSVIVE